MDRYTLSPSQEDATLQGRLRQLTPFGSPDDRPSEAAPRALIIGGQPGAGKTMTQRLAWSSFPPYTALYDGDDNATHHPAYDDISLDNPRDGHAIASSHLPDGFHNACLDHLRAGNEKYDVIASHPLGKTEWAQSWVDGFKGHGYHVSAAFIATHESNSLLGVLSRYQQSRDIAGHGRWLPPERHDEFYENIPDVADHLERSGSVDSIFVLDRSGSVLHENHLGEDGVMTRPPSAREAIVAERNRPPLEAEVKDFEEKVAYLRDDRLRVHGAPEELSSHVDEAERRHQQHRMTAQPSATAADHENRESIGQALARSRATDHQAPAPPPSDAGGDARRADSDAPVPASPDDATVSTTRSEDVAEKLRSAEQSFDARPYPDRQTASIPNAGSAAPESAGTSAEATSDKLRRARQRLDTETHAAAPDSWNASSEPSPSPYDGRQPE